MIRSTRHMLAAGIAVAATMSLALGSVAAQDDGTEEMASMEPMQEMEAGLHVHDAWARVSPMMDLAGAAYMVIHNETDADDALVGASSPAAEFVELHLSSVDDEGMMSMDQVMEIPVPAGADAELKPGSYHVMLINLVEPLEEGTEVELALEFMTAEPQTVSVPVMAGPPMRGDMDMDEMDHADDMDAEGDEEMEEDEG